VTAASAQMLLRKILEQVGGSAESGFVLVLDGEGLADLPPQMATPHGTYSVCRLTSEIRLRHTLWKAQGAPLIAVIPPTLASRLPPDLFRRARNQRVHALAANDVLEAILETRVIGADEPYLQQLAIENVEKLAIALQQRTRPTVVDRRLFTEMLVDVSVGEHVRALKPSALLASWAKDPPAWSEHARKLVTGALPTLHGDEGRLLAWALGPESSRERLRALIVHGAILTIDAAEVPKDAWGPLWDASAHPPIAMDRRIVRTTLTRLAEGALALLGDAAGSLLLEAEDIGRRKLTPSLLSTSRVLPLAFHDRCFELAKRAAGGQPIGADEIEWLRSHRAAPMGRAELLVLEAMGRLSRYLDIAPTTPGSVTEHVTRYQREGAFADLASLQLRRAMAGSGRYLAEAKQILERYRARRDDDNRAFASVLASGYEAALHHKDVVPLHRLWKRLVAPLWQDAPDTRLYLVVLDGCSYPVFLDLLYDLAQHAAFPMGIRPDEAGRVAGLPALSPLPTITSHARGAIFLGELPQDTLVAETVFRDQQEARTDKARLNQNAALGERTRELFLKGDLADGGQRLLSSLRGDTQVVATVFNAVDDQIGSSNTGAVVRIAPESIMAFRPSLEAALQSGRRVLITADHGHSPYVDNTLRVAEGGTPRFTPLAAGAAVPAGFLEIDVGGLGGPPGRRAFAWKSGAYLGGQQVGFHGGASLEEMVVPLAWLVPSGLQADEPSWWFGRGALPFVEQIRRAPEPPTLTPVPTPPPQLDLFGGGTTASALGIPDGLLTKLTADERSFLALLKENGTLKSSEVVARMKKPPSRVNGLIAQLQRKLHASSLELFITEKLPSGEMLYRFTRVS